MNCLDHLDSEATIGVRPEDIQLGSGNLRATVELVERLGFESHVHLALGSERLVARIEGTPPSGTVALQFRRTHRFDRTSGLRL